MSSWGIKLGDIKCFDNGHLLENTFSSPIMVCLNQHHNGMAVFPWQFDAWIKKCDFVNKTEIPVLCKTRLIFSFIHFTWNTLGNNYFELCPSLFASNKNESRHSNW